MFQTFNETANSDQGPHRLAALRNLLSQEGLDGFIIPRADAHQGEYVAPCDERLAWLTGFTGSAGWCIVLLDRAAVFTDSRYTVQVRAQVAECFDKIDWPATSLAEYIRKACPQGRIGFAPWLLSVNQLAKLQEGAPEAQFTPCANLIDTIWENQPDPPCGKVTVQPLQLTGESHQAKIDRLARDLTADAAVITLPDSIAWLLNIRGSDIPRNPVPLGFAILHRGKRVTLFMDPAKLTGIENHFGAQVDLRPPEALASALAALDGDVQIDPETCPVAITDALGAQVVHAADPCLLPKAVKTPEELAGARAAHERDALAMIRFLAWLDATPPGSLSEIDIVKRLEEERRATGVLCDISFETIAGAGPHGAIVHYRVTQASNRVLKPGELLLLDSGGQYRDGTTDITRTIAIGEIGEQERNAFTRTLKGMISLSRLRFPKGLAGRDIDAFARAALWEAGLDYGHGTGHGVGSYLSVHEGPQRIARSGTVPLEPGMILSNEPGFYREGAFGIRIENLIAVQTAPALPGQTVPEMLCFETLTHVPIDRRLICPALLSDAERDWINAYHAKIMTRATPHLNQNDAKWLAQACRAI